jgi:hypothetical protein
MNEPDAIYLDPDGLHYIAQFADDDDTATWLRWPAIENGWATRHRGSSPLADACAELDAWHARLALRLSGVMYDDR